MRWFFGPLAGVALARHHNIRGEIDHFYQTLKELKHESSVLQDNRKTLAKVSEDSLQTLQKLERRGETVALATLGKNDAAFNMVEQQMESKIY